MFTGGSSSEASRSARQKARINRWYGIHIDIEEQRRAQQSLMLAQENLSRLTHTLGMAEMAASIAHELNQPLTAVVTHAYACREWLQSKPANLKASATAEKIVQESTRASAVVKRVRALFRKEAQAREPADMNRLIRDWPGCCAMRHPARHSIWLRWRRICPGSKSIRFRSSRCC